MFLRILIVLLLVLNLGVALWWAMRSAPVPAAESALPPGVERLQLRSEVEIDWPAALPEIQDEAEPET